MSAAAEGELDADGQALNAAIDALGRLRSARDVVLAVRMLDDAQLRPIISTLVFLIHDDRSSPEEHAAWLEAPSDLLELGLAGGD